MPFLFGVFPVKVSDFYIQQDTGKEEITSWTCCEMIYTYDLLACR